MIVEILGDAHAVGRRMGEALMETLRGAAGSGRTATIGLSGGSTPRLMYAFLRDCDAAPILRQGIYFWGDERSVPADSAESNVGEARREFLDVLGVPETNIHAVNGGAGDLAAEAARYDALLRERLPAGANGFPALDLLLLGMGEDGHTASLFPGTAALDERERTFVLNDVPAKQTKRLTLTIPAIRAAREIIVGACGAGKAGVIAAIRARGTAAPVYPIEGALAGLDKVRWVLDRAAGG